MKKRPGLAHFFLKKIKQSRYLNYTPNSGFFGEPFQYPLRDIDCIEQIIITYFTRGSIIVFSWIPVLLVWNQLLGYVKIINIFAWLFESKPVKPLGQPYVMPSPYDKYSLRILNFRKCALKSHLDPLFLSKKILFRDTQILI